MEFRFQILGSSSSGNCALLCTPECKVLIDAGFSAREIGKRLQESGERLEDIDAVFLTHEHSDHTAGLRGLLRHKKVEFFANRDTAFAAQSRLGERKGRWKLFETGSAFRYRDLTVTPFSVPHDAHDPVGYVFEHGHDDLFSPRRSVAWVTDLGHLPRLVSEKVHSADVLVIEANHDVEMLEMSPRPWSLKQRIRGRHGHLSNDAAFDFLAGAEQPRWQRIYLAHLSRECNSLECVERTFAPLRQGGKNFHIDVVDPQNGVMPALAFSSLA